MNVNTEELVGVGEIARIAKVNKSAVSNWIKRHKTFPAPLASLDCGDVFRMSDVQKWLEKTGRI